MGKSGHGLVSLLNVDHVSLTSIRAACSFIFVYPISLICSIGGFSFEKDPRHDAYVPRFEAELAHFCEKLVSSMSLICKLYFDYHLHSISIIA